MYNGVLNVYKEPGYTSFDVVAKLRGILKQKKIGHTGTLDPDAEGVLVVCLGKATKLCDILTDKDKSYVATLLLGMTTDTEDTSGKILTTKEVNVTEDEVKRVILSYVKEYDQIPPMYSAIKVNGKKLYELARNGEVIERTPRKVQIHNIEILEMDLPRVRFKVSCGKGTYIRSLCRDIGETLGCGGVMEHLIRDCVKSTDTGKTFTLSNSLRLSEIEELAKTEKIQNAILSIDEMFPQLVRYKVNESGQKKLENGNFLHKNDLIHMGNEAGVLLKENESYLIYDLNSEFRAIYKFNKSLKQLKVDKMF